MLKTIIPLFGIAAADSINGVAIPQVDINIKVLGTQVGTEISFEEKNKW